ncbi:hypothetical protein BD779DRAFT_163962 [Infundibulicybe gibba]|nr:hypothetical protein BD779DRAFT_163962 [Infundibulicybe gibba]
MSVDPSSTNPSLSHDYSREGIADDGRPSERPKPRRSNNPPLCSTDYPHYFVLAFPTSLKFLRQWGVDHGLTGNEIQTSAAWNTIEARVWKYGCQWGVVRANGIESLGIVVASNRTPEDLARASDLKMIQAVQAVLGTTEKPLWRKPIDL